MRDLVDRGKTFIKTGYAAWKILLENNDYSENALKLLNDLGIDSLVMSLAATEACAVGFADKVETPGRCGLEQMSTMMAWMGECKLRCKYCTSSTL